MIFVARSEESSIQFTSLIFIDQNDGVFLLASSVLQAKLLYTNHSKVCGFLLHSHRPHDAIILYYV